MPRVPRFRDARGRFIRAKDAEEFAVSVEFYDTPTGILSERTPAVEYFSPEPEPEPPSIFWQTETTDRLLIWKDFAEDADRNFAPFAPPEGVTQFRVYAYMNSDSTDERGIASSEWHKLTEWPPRPSWIGAHGAPQIDFVAFDRGSNSAES